MEMLMCSSLTFIKHERAKKNPSKDTSYYSTSIPVVLGLCPLNYGCHRHHRLLLLQHRQLQQRSHFPEITTKRCHIKTHRTRDTTKYTPRAALSSTDRPAAQPLGRSPARLDYFLASRYKKRRQTKKKHPPPKLATLPL